VNFFLILSQILLHYSINTTITFICQRQYLLKFKLSFSRINNCIEIKIFYNNFVFGEFRAATETELSLIGIKAAPITPGLCCLTRLNVPHAFKVD